MVKSGHNVSFVCDRNEIESIATAMLDQNTNITEQIKQEMSTIHPDDLRNLEMLILENKDYHDRMMALVFESHNQFPDPTR